MRKELTKRYAGIKGKNKKGFTLVELIVAMGIMAVLALIMVPNVTAYIKKAEIAKVRAEMKIIYTAAEVSRLDNNGMVNESDVWHYTNYIQPITLLHSEPFVEYDLDVYYVCFNPEAGVIEMIKIYLDEGEAQVFDGKEYRKSN